MASSRAHKMQKGQYASGGSVGRAMRTMRRHYADGGDVVKDRAMFLPLGTYGDGTTRAAWPGLLYEPAAAWKRMMDSGYRPGDAETTRQMAEDSFTVAGAAPIAGLAAGAVRGRMPRATLSSNAAHDAAKRLPMDEASRMARAREMGYDKVYHGSKNDLEGYREFDTSDRSLDASVPNPRGDNIGAFFAENPSHSRDFGENVRAYGVALKNPREFATQDEFRAFIRDNSGRTPDVRDAEGFIVKEGVFQHNARKVLEDQGYDGVVIRRPNYTKTVKSDRPWRIAFRPNQVRDWQRAAFDPARADSSDLLASNPSTASILSLMQNRDERK